MGRAYGKEFTLDLKDCRDGTFQRGTIEKFLSRLCELLDVNREEIHWWDYEGYETERADAAPHMAGVSVVQFISKSTVTIHTIDHGRILMLNVFTCGDLDKEAVETLAINYFGGVVTGRKLNKRGSGWSV